MGNNNAASADYSVPLTEEMRAFDLLPGELRHALNYAVHCYSAHETRVLYELGARIEQLTAAISRRDRQRR